jgi:NAD(P)-dependent dehydrogenase (short-subunit alcohol dehydrogenase family)
VTETPLIAEGKRLSAAFATEIDGIVRATPLGRMARPEDVAEAVVFLSTAASSFITGQLLSVNGGQVMAG